MAGGLFKRLVEGLTKTRNNIVSGIDNIFKGFSHIDEEFYEELEEVLIMGDLGVRATMEILDNLRQKVKEQHIKEPQACKELLIESIKEQSMALEKQQQLEKLQGKCGHSIKKLFWRRQIHSVQRQGNS